MRYLYQFNKFRLLDKLSIKNIKKYDKKYIIIYITEINRPFILNDFYCVFLCIRIRANTLPCRGSENFRKTCKINRRPSKFKWELVR